jgi:hypothetical protein
MSHRVAAWLAWSLCALAVVLIVSGIALPKMLESATPALSYGGAVDTAFTLATWLPFSVVGAIVASRHPRNPIGWIFCTVALVVGISTLAGGYAEVWLKSGWGSKSLGETAAWFSSWVWSALVVIPTTFLLLLFPDGRLPSPRWRPVAWSAGLGITGFVVGNALAPGPLGDFLQIANPYGIDSPIVEIVGVAGGIVAAVCGAALVVVLIGFSRMYLGVHYFSDVVAGYAAGGVWLSALITGAETIRRGGKHGTKPEGCP